jgi:hypothetical protein
MICDTLKLALNPLPLTSFEGVTIELTEDPLDTPITLDDRAKREFTLLIALKAMQDLVWETQFYIDNNDTEKTKKQLARFTEMKEHDEFSEGSYGFWSAYAEKYHSSYILNALQDSHFGDCICQASSCDKCLAERLLGIDTCWGMGKHSFRLSKGILNRDLQKYPLVAPVEKHAYECAIKHRELFDSQSRKEVES